MTTYKRKMVGEQMIGQTQKIRQDYLNTEG